LHDEREWTLPGSELQWEAVRRGLYGVVNDADGTAHNYAYLDPSCGYALCGKTGSAEVASPWVVSYALRYVDEHDHERTTTVAASTRSEAIAEFVRTHPRAAVDYQDIEIAETWPDQPPEHGRLHSHAWFAGYLQPLNSGGQPDYTRTAPIAFAVLVEFGGSGGRVSAPIGRDVALKIIELLGPHLDADQPVAGAQIADAAAPQSAGREQP
jgi:cell division protein FtsI/penicillin-binding protein 2